MTRAVLLLVLASAVSCLRLPHDVGNPSYQPLEATSLVALLANPQAFHGKRVWVAGVVRFEFEGNALYLTQEHYEHRLGHYALWIDPDSEALGATPDELSSLNGRYVLAEGVVNADCGGHLGSFAACLQSVSQIRTVD